MLARGIVERSIGRVQTTKIHAKWPIRGPASGVI